MDSASQKLTGVTSKEKQQNMDLASLKLTGEEKSSPTTHRVDACSWKLTGEENSESTIQVNVFSLRLIRELTKPHPNRHSITEVDWRGHDPSLLDACSLKWIGELITPVSSLP